MEEKDVKTPVDLLAYIFEYEDVIFVRELVNGKMDSVALKDLNPKAKATKIMRFLEEGILPVRLLREGEVKNA